MEHVCAVLGAGAWGTALAQVLRSSDRRVLVWNRRSDDTLLKDARIVIAAVPAQQTRAVLVRLRPVLHPEAVIVLAAKGLETGTYLRQSQIVEGVLPGARLAVLSGPGFADDLLAGLPTALTVATLDREAEALQRYFAVRTLRPYLSSDIAGTELGGALKNVIAIGCGLAIGAGLGESARAAVLTRGFAEITRVAVALGADASTLSGLSGLGDLVLTGTSEKSRNYRYGLQMGASGSLAPAGTVEGRATAGAARDLCESLGLDAPMIRTIARVTEGAITLENAIPDLFNRPLTREGA